MLYLNCQVFFKFKVDHCFQFESNETLARITAIKPTAFNDNETVCNFGSAVLEAVGARDEALDLELEARREVEEAIAGAK